MYSISVFDFGLFSFPQCISIPSDVNVSLISWVPLVASGLDSNGNAQSLRYNACRISVEVTCLFVFMSWPVSCPCVEVVFEFWWWTLTFLMSVAFHFFSNVSAKAVMMNRKITGDRLSPWQTPTV